MKNNRLTAKYIKDIFRFMEMYNVNSTNIGSVSFILNVYNNIKYAKYCICIEDDTQIITDLCSGEDTTVYYNGDSISGLLQDIKYSEHYMMELIKC